MVDSKIQILKFEIVRETAPAIVEGAAAAVPAAVAPGKPII